MPGGLNPLILTNGWIGRRLVPTTSSVRGSIVGSGDALVLSNPSNVTVYAVIGSSTVVATTSGYPILPGTKEDELVLDVLASYYNAPYIAAICESGTGILLIHRGGR